MQDKPRGKKRKLLGEILVDAGLLNEQELSHALQIQKQTGDRLGYVLIKKGFISEAHLIQALSKQLSVPWISLSHIDVSPPLLEMVPRDVIVNHGVVPVYLMGRGGGGRTLYVAMDDPTNEDVLNQISTFADVTVKAMIAAPSELAQAIRSFYGLSWEAGESLHAGLIEQKEQRQHQIEPREISSHPQIRDDRQDQSGSEEETFVLPPSAEVVEDSSPQEPEAQLKQQEPIKLEEVAQRGDEAAEVEGADSETAGSATPSEPPVQEKKQFRAPVSFTLLNGTTISFARGLARRADGQENEVDLMEKINSLLIEDGIGLKLRGCIIGIVELLFKRGLITMEEMKGIIEKMKD